jgi:hypothetical protein
MREKIVGKCVETLNYKGWLEGRAATVGHRAL